MVTPVTETTALLRDLLGSTKLVVADVGAANGVLAHFLPVQEVATFFLFEPEKSAYDKLVAAQKQAGRSNVRVINTALAATRGPRTLYVANQPTGSSLLKPRADVLEYIRPSYFFPIREVQIETERLENVLNDAGEPALHMIKIDVQGAEMEVLEGLGARANTLLSVQSEVGMPGAYEGQPSFGDVDKWMNAHGLTLFDLIPARCPITLDGDKHAYHLNVFKTFRSDTTLRSHIWEGELFYFRREELVLEERSADQVRRLAAAYCVHSFFSYAHRLATRAAEKNIITATEAKKIQDIVVKWHDVKASSSLRAKARRFVRRVTNQALSPEQSSRIYNIFGNGTRAS